jgi:hypothetical protein
MSKALPESRKIIDNQDIPVTRIIGIGTQVPVRFPSIILLHIFVQKDS